LSPSFELNLSRSGSLPVKKNHQGGLGDSEDESDAKIFSVPDTETGQQSAPPSSSKCQQFNKAQQGNAERVLIANNFGTMSVSHGDQSFSAVFLELQCASAQLLRFSTIADDSNLLFSGKLSDQGCISFIW